MDQPENQRENLSIAKSDKWEAVDRGKLFQAWAATPQKTSESARVHDVAALVGCSDRSARRILSKAGCIQKRRNRISVTLPSRGAALDRIRSDPAGSAVRTALAAGVALGLPVKPLVAGAVLGQVLGQQKGRIAEAGEAVTRLGVRLRELTEDQYDEAGQRLPLDERQVHQGIATAERLVATIAKLHEEERRCWGIREDKGAENWADTLQALDSAQVIGGQVVIPEGPATESKEDAESSSESQVPETESVSEPDIGCVRPEQLDECASKR